MLTYGQDPALEQGPVSPDLLVDQDSQLLQHEALKVWNSCLQISSSRSVARPHLCRAFLSTWVIALSIAHLGLYEEAHEELRQRGPLDQLLQCRCQSCLSELRPERNALIQGTNDGFQRHALLRRINAMQRDEHLGGCAQLAACDCCRCHVNKLPSKVGFPLRLPA